MTSALALLAATSAGVAVHLGAGAYAARAGPDTRAEQMQLGSAAVRPAPDKALLTRLRAPLAVLAAAGAWAFLGGLPGVVGGVAAAVLAWRVLTRVEGPAARRRREQLVAELPTGVDLFGACLAGGAAVDNALATVAAALPGPLGEELDALHHRLQLGADPASVWEEVARDAHLGPLGRAVGRAHETGASINSAIGRLAVELRARRRAEVEQRARSVDVKAAAPLGVCFLPAFLLLGVVPLVAGVFGSMRFFG